MANFSARNPPAGDDVRLGGTPGHVVAINQFGLSLALVPPLLFKLVEDGTDAAMARLGLLTLGLLVAYAWSAVFAKRLWQAPSGSQLGFAMLFALMLPAPLGWVGVLLATSFGWVFGREVFGGRAILSPTLVALAFAIFSFPKAGYEALSILSAEPSPGLALACLPGAAWLLWKRVLAWRIVIGAMAGATLASLVSAAAETPAWWEHFVLGSFAIGVLFLAAAPENAPRRELARWFHGAMVGVLVIVIRLAHPEQPDGVVFAALLGGLFAPLVDRALGWRSPREPD